MSNKARQIINDMVRKLRYKTKRKIEEARKLEEEANKLEKQANKL